MLKSHENSVGAWAFLIGVVLALAIGIFTTLLPIPALIDYSAQIYSVLALLGVIIGFMIVRGKDSQTFLLAGVIIVIVSKFGMDSITGSLIGIGLYDIVSSIFSAFLVLFVPATIIVALKTVFAIAKV